MNEEVTDIHILINQLDNMKEQEAIRENIARAFNNEERRREIFEEVVLQYMQSASYYKLSEHKNRENALAMCEEWAEFILEESKIFAKKK